MKALVVGLGIGNLYVNELTNLGFHVDTVDSNPDKNPTFQSVNQLTDVYSVAVICTPNFTHESIAREIASKCSIVFIEKPGVKDAKAWQKLTADFPNTRFLLVKNNQYRDTIDEFQRLAKQSTVVRIVWENANRIPQPGSWFTNKELAFGGVSRDLIPHMLSYFTVLANIKNNTTVYSSSVQNHKLENIVSSDYGVVNHNGTYNVDDRCELTFVSNNKTWELVADWKTDKETTIGIEFDYSVFFPLGLCPESAYNMMIKTAVENIDNKQFWQDQYEQDLWIHQQLEAL